MLCGICLVTGGNLVDCSAAVVSQNGDCARISSVNDDCAAAVSQQNKAGKVVVRVNIMVSWFITLTQHLVKMCFMLTGLASTLSLSLSLRFNGHFPGEPGLVGV